VITSLLSKYNAIDIDNARWIVKTSQSNNAASPSESPSKKDSTKELQLAAKETEQVLVKVPKKKEEKKMKKVLFIAFQSLSFSL
jgi:hypothetical protein